MCGYVLTYSRRIIRNCGDHKHFHLQYPTVRKKKKDTSTNQPVTDEWVAYLKNTITALALSPRPIIIGSSRLENRAFSVSCINMHKLCAFWFHTLTATRSILHQDNAVPLWGQSLVTCLRSSFVFVFYRWDGAAFALQGQLAPIYNCHGWSGFFTLTTSGTSTRPQSVAKKICHNYATCHSLPTSIFYSKQTHYKHALIFTRPAIHQQKTIMYYVPVIEGLSWLLEGVTLCAPPPIWEWTVLSWCRLSLMQCILPWQQRTIPVSWPQGT